MRDTRPRPFEGSLLADGLLVEKGLAGQAFAARVVATIAGGGRAYHLDDGILVIFVAPRRVRMEASGGTPFVRHGRSLVGFEHADSVVRGHEDGSLLRLRGGIVAREPLASLREVDPSELVVVPTLRPHTMRSLGEPPAPPKSARDEVRGMRELLAIPVHPDRVEVQAALAAPQRLRDGWMRRMLAALRRWIGGVVARRAARIPANVQATNHRGGTNLVKVDHTPSWLDRSLTWLTQRLAVFERLTGRQARYLEDVLEKLEKGDFDEALRMAIPLADGAHADPCRIALGVPSPRADLRIEPNAAPPSSTMPFGQDVEALLRQSYEQAFRSLDRQKRHREAAFVLEELLRQHMRAVDYLESHDELRVAAQVAEARGLPADRIVALWFRAGERERAIAVARRTGTFGPAIERLERIDRSAAAALRLEYADLLAAAGDYLRAVDVVWPVTEARALARTWLGRAIEAGGLAAARSWPRALALLEPSTEDVRSRLLPLLLDRSLDGAYFRQTFAIRAIDEAIPPLGYHALKVAYRGLLRDRHELGRDVDRLVRQVEEKVGDAILVADAPPLTARSAPIVSSTPLVFGPLDVGSMRAFDAIALPDGRVIVAMGELGVRIVGRTGKTELVFAVPAHGLVLDDRGERALAVAVRSDALRFARIDLLTRRAEPWIDVACYAVCGSFDGEALYVAQRNGSTSTLVCLDALAAEASVLYSVTGLRGDVLDVDRNVDTLRVLLKDSPDATELLSFALPSRILLARRTVGASERIAGLGNVFAPVSWLASDPHRDALGLDTDAPRFLRWTEESEGVVVREGFPDEEGHVVLELARAADARLRRHGDFVTVADDRGRVIVLDRRSLAVVSSIVLT